MSENPCKTGVHGGGGNRTRELFPRSNRRCSVCGDDKPLELFAKDKRKPDGCSYRCRACDNERKRQYLLRDPEAVSAARRRSFFKTTYGLTPEDIRRLAEAQGGVCAICKRSDYGFPQVDHCHRSGAIRGLLCNECNTGLGKLGDDVAGLQRAIDYLTSARIEVAA